MMPVPAIARCSYSTSSVIWNAALASASRQRAQCRWLGWCAQAGRCALPGQGLTHLFPAAAAMPEVSWKPSGSSLCDPATGRKSPNIRVSLEVIGESRFQSLSRARPLDILTLRSIFGNLKTSFELGTETFGVRALTPSLLGRGRA